MMESFKLVGTKIVNLREAKKLNQETACRKRREYPLERTQKKSKMVLRTAVNQFLRKSGAGAELHARPDFAQTDREHRRQVNLIKKLLQAAPTDVLREVENLIKAKLKIK